jgi:adenine phosphoribosyltransferase
MDFKDLIRTVNDFPKPGVVFRDITTLIANPEGFTMAIEALCRPYLGKHIDLVAGIEARGFILAAPMAQRLNAGFLPIRKKGKLPPDTVQQDYKLEYGTDALEIGTHLLKPGMTVLLVDDVIATGGTALAAASLLKQLDITVLACVFLIDLPHLGGAVRLRDAGYEVLSLVNYS